MVIGTVRVNAHNSGAFISQSVMVCSSCHIWRVLSIEYIIKF